MLLLSPQQPLVQIFHSATLKHSTPTCNLPTERKYEAFMSGILEVYINKISSLLKNGAGRYIDERKRYVYCYLM